MRCRSMRCQTGAASEEGQAPAGLARVRARHVSLQDKYIEMRRSKKRNTKKRSISTTRKSKEIDIYRTKTACARTRIGGRTVWAA